jgi:hypothetical protein
MIRGLRIGSRYIKIYKIEYEIGAIGGFLEEED